MPSSVDFSRGHAGCTNESTTIFPSRPVSTTMLPPGPESMTTPSASLRRFDRRGAHLRAHLLDRRIRRRRLTPVSEGRLDARRVPGDQRGAADEPRGPEKPAASGESKVVHLLLPLEKPVEKRARAPLELVGQRATRGGGNVE